MFSISCQFVRCLNVFTEVMTLLQEWKLEPADQLWSKETSHLPNLSEMCITLFEKNKARRK